MNQEIVSLLKAALEASVYLSPRNPGLSFQELAEVAKRAGYLEGEVNDALRHAGLSFFGSPQVKPLEQDATQWVFFFDEDPDYKNFHALDVVFDELNLQLRSEGEARAAIERSVLVERGVAKGLSRHDMEVAVTVLVMSNQLAEKNDIVRFAQRGGTVRQLPSVTRSIHRYKTAKPNLARAYPLVKDVLERREDGRPRYVEPLDAFGDELERLGYGRFRIWWTQMVSEMRQSNPISTSVAITVLAAALVEGALTFIVKHARSTGRFQSNDYEKDPRNWKIDDLVKSASAGGSDAILDRQACARAEALIRARQRIHAGRMLSEFPAGPPDLRPDEARQARETADQVVRAVLDWLEKNPTAGSP
jgi:hypothetical protein